MTAWDAAPAAPMLGVVGPRAVTERLQHAGLAAQRLLPTCATVDGLDAVLLTRSAVTTGSWAGALRPTGFDRGAVLARLLRAAAERSLPMVLLEDLPVEALDGWDAMLDGAVDDALVLGPLGVGGHGWHPGLHWDATALRLAVERPAGVDPDAVPELTAADIRHDWRWAQRRAAAAGRVVVDDRDPWSRHLAGELLLLGVDVRDRHDQPVRRQDDAAPTAAAAWLSDRLGLPAPPAPRSVVQQTDGTTERDGATQDACRTALDRLGADGELAVRLGATLVATAGLDRAVPSVPPATAIDLGALA